MTQSSYSMRWFRQGVVSNTGGIDTGELMNPINDIFIIIIIRESGLKLRRSSLGKDS